VAKDKNSKKPRKPAEPPKLEGRHPSQRPIPLVNNSPTEEPPSQRVKDALKLVDEISETISEDVPEWKVLKNQSYFDGVEDRAKAIGETITHTGRVSDAQVTALENMLAGVKKWV
jgi:hypothetical protein